MSQSYRHGGALVNAARETGVAPEKILDFSSNINPMGLPARAAERLAHEASDPMKWKRYPDPEHRELRSALSGYACVPEACIAIGAGADSLIHAAVHAFAPRRVVIRIPAFSEYERACLAAGCEAIFVSDKNPDLCAGDFLVINNPRNPSGACATREAMLEQIDAARRAGAMVMVDEAFIDYVPEASVTQHAAESDGVIVIRSLTKFFGCPGLRVGYAVALPDTVQTIADQLPPWPVTTLAANALAEALQDTAYQSETREKNRRAREALSEALSGLGFQVFPSAANFLLVAVPAGLSAGDLRRHLLRQHAILVRECDSFAGLEAGRYLRIAVRREDENRRLTDALTQILQGESCLQTHS